MSTIDTVLSAKPPGPPSIRNPPRADRPTIRQRFPRPRSIPVAHRSQQASTTPGPAPRLRGTAGVTLLGPRPAPATLRSPPPESPMRLIVRDRLLRSTPDILLAVPTKTNAVSAGRRSATLRRAQSGSTNTASPSSTMNRCPRTLPVTGSPSNRTAPGAPSHRASAHDGASCSVGSFRPMWQSESLRRRFVRRPFEVSDRSNHRDPLAQHA